MSQVHVIEPRHPGIAARAIEFWRYRSVLGYFGRRYVEKGYLRTWLGWAWIPLRPVLDVGSRVLVFGALLGAPSAGVPYLLFFLIGMMAWQFFASTTYWATRSIELNRRVLKRMYMPRLTVLVASAAPSMLNFLIYFAIAALIVGYYGLADGHVYVQLGPETAVAAAGMVLMLLLALGIGLWTSVYAAQARDVRFVLSYILGFWFFLTPVIYPLSAVPEDYRRIAEFNPMTAPVEMFKYGVLGIGEIPLTGLAVTAVVIAALVGAGLWFFARSESAALDSL